MRIRHGTGFHLSRLQQQPKPQRPHGAGKHARRAPQAKGAGGRNNAQPDGDLFELPEADDAPVFSGVGRVVELKRDAGLGGFAPRDLQFAQPRPESGMALAMWFERLARDLSHSNGLGFRAFVRPAAGDVTDGDELRRTLGLDAQQPARLVDLGAYVSRRIGAMPELELDWKELLSAMHEHLRGLRLIDAGLAPQNRLYLGGLGPDGTFAGLRTRSR